MKEKEQLDLAKKLIKKSEYARAAKILKKIKFGKYKYAIKNNLAICYKELGFKKRSEALLKEAINIDKDNFIAYANLSNCYLERQEFALSKNYALKALSLNKKLYPMFKNIGIFYLKQGKDKKSLVYFKKALKNIDEKTPILLNKIIAEYIKEKMYSEAISLYKSFCANDALYKDKEEVKKIYNKLGYCSYLIKDYNNAIIFFLKSIKTKLNYTAVKNYLRTIIEITNFPRKERIKNWTISIKN